MPTGYTMIIEEGDGCTFAEYVWRCARGFGALMHMRDDDFGAPIRQREPWTHYEDDIAKARAEIDRLLSMTPEQIAAASKADQDAAAERIRGYNAADAAKRERYARMRAEVECWDPPTPQHVELKKFMLQQIDTSTEYLRPTPEPERVTSAQWHTERLRIERRSLHYYEDAMVREKQRVEESRAWCAALDASVPMPDALRPGAGTADA